MNKFALLPPERMEAHLANFLLDHLSVSAVQTFARNEKSFEKTYIFKDYSMDGESESRVIGKVYHHTLRAFFEEWEVSRKKLSYDRLMQIAFDELDTYKGKSFKPYVNKTIIEIKQNCEKYVNVLIENFLREVDVYLSDIQKVVFVETKLNAFITLNEIDIPLPFKAVPDLVYINMQGELVVLDHKSVGKYTPENEALLEFAYQGIVYGKVVSAVVSSPEFSDLRKKYPAVVEGVKKVLFYQNKYTMNRDKTPQIKFHTVDMKDSGVYEFMLFQVVWRIIQAVQDPDYIYLMNPSDHFQNKGEMVDFWLKTHLEDLDAFSGLNTAQKKILGRRKVLVKKSALSKVPKHVLEAMKGSEEFISFDPSVMENMTTAEKVEFRLRCFNFTAKVAHIVEGYSCDTLLLEVGVGAQVSKIHGYRLDIANVLGVEDVRISESLVRYKDGTYIAIEVNRNREERKTVKLTPAIKMRYSDLQLPLGIDNFGNVVAWDFGNPSTPYFMLSGAAGSGKSVLIQTMMHVALERNHNVTVLDPKFEFGGTKCQVLNEQHDIEAFIAEQVKIMDEIYKAKGKKAGETKKHIIFFDEVADCLAKQTKERRIDRIEGPNPKYNPLVALALEARGEVYSVPEFKTKNVKDPEFKTLEENLLILAQKGRAAGIHLVLAAQRFSTKILTGDVKANFTTRLALTCAKKVDSIVMIDQEGAEALNGRGDGLLVSPDLKGAVRIQCFTL